MVTDQVFDEEAFYGRVDTFYLLEENNLGGLYEQICGQFARHCPEYGKGHFVFPKKSLVDVVIRVEHGFNSREFISVHILPCIANILFSPETSNLLSIVENITEENNFKLIKG